MYDEGMVVGKNMRGKFRGILLMAGMGIFMKLMSISLTRTVLLNTILPKPGEGPSKEERDNGYFKMLVIGEDEEKERRIEVMISDTNDPGYGSTAKMLAESGLALALDRDSLPSNFGVLTPAAGLGYVIVERLKKAGMNISVNG